MADVCGSFFKELVPDFCREIREDVKGTGISWARIDAVRECRHDSIVNTEILARHVSSGKLTDPSGPRARSQDSGRGAGEERVLTIMHAAVT